MKRTRKLILALVVVMSLLMAMAVAIIPASAANNIPANTVLYLKPSNTWKTDGARFAAYFFGNGEAWVSMTDKDGDGVYECTSPNKSFPKVIFCRMNPSATANNWNNKWNQTADLTFDGNKNYYEPTEGWWDTMGVDCWTKHQCFDGPAATCETDQTCPLCGNVQKAKLGHSYDDGVVTTEPTCTEKGVKTFTCSTCEGTKTEDVASLGHNFVEGVCDREGCDAEDPDYCAHSNVTHYEAKDATCTENGNIEYWLCVDCGQAWLDEAQTLNTNVLAVVLPTIDHSYKAVVTEPTCIKAGYTTYTCDCGDSYTEAGAAATGHTFVDEKCACGQNQYVIVYFQNNWLWTNVSIYAFNEGGFIGEAWPGAKATFVKNDGTYDIYSAKVPYNATGIIFNGVKNDGTGALDQTPDITSNITNCVMFYMHYDSKEGTQARIADKGIHTYVDGKCSACGHEAETFEEAITGTGTVTLTEDLELAGPLVIGEKLVIDLNGHVLKATGLVTFAADAIIDSSAKWENDEFVEPTGLLIIPQFKIVIPTPGLYMPIWNTVNEVSGYQFVEMKDQQKVVDTVPGDDSFNVVFRPSIGDTAFNNKIFGDVENNGLEFVINVYNGTLVDGEFVAAEGDPISGMLDPETVATAYEGDAVKAVNVKFTGADFTDGNCYSVELFIRIKTLDENGAEKYINAYYTILAVVGAEGEI